MPPKQRQSWLTALVSHVAVLSAVGIAVLMLLTTVDVVLRRAFGYPVPGAIEVAEVVLVATVFLGLAHTYVRGQHVEITVFAEMLSERLQGWLAVAGRMVAGLSLIWLSYATFIAARRSFRTREFRIGLVDVPIWPARIAIAVGTVLLLVVVLSKLRDRR